ncbi:MAG: beta-ketoacyl synthase N-terminal-like domain-containing protein [Calditrichaeota bacterium]|nr:beta-ketoacyl synthase N-terminal-like domain-containing protein [Calditrichota bacterium]
MVGQMMQPAERVVITGLAASTCCGVGIEPLFQRFARGLRSNADSEADFSSQTNGFKKFAKISLDIRDLVRKTRTDNLLTQHVLAAVECDLGTQISQWNEEIKGNVGVVLGNTSGHVKQYLKYYMTATREGYEFVNPMHFPATLLNYSTVQLNNAFSLRGSSTTISSGFSAGFEAIGYAALQLKLGREQLMLAGGIEEMNDLILGILHREAFSKLEGIQPLSKGDRTTPGEGVGILMLESLLRAEREGRKPFGEILGYGNCKGDAKTGDLHRIAAAALYRALQQADLGVGDIEAIFPSANGNPAVDGFELRVLKEVFGSRLQSIPLYPIESIIGECFTAAGPLQCIAATYALHMETDPTKHPQTRANGLLLPNTISPCRMALVSSLGFDHTFSAMIIGKVN